MSVRLPAIPRPSNSPWKTHVKGAMSPIPRWMEALSAVRILWASTTALSACSGEQEA